MYEMEFISQYSDIHVALVYVFVLLLAVSRQRSHQQAATGTVHVRAAPHSVEPALSRCVELLTVTE